MSASMTVDLGAPAPARWTLPRRLVEQARVLMQAYTAELGGVDAFGELLAAYAAEHIRDDHFEEVESLAVQTGQSVEEVLLGNLYYDAVKLVLGCTAFAVDTPDGPLHARNLDWWTENDALSEFTLVTDFVREGVVSFRTVGWPGFVGALSGVAPGRFAITLNAVLSGEPSAAETPISFLIRSVLEEARTFREAVERLADTPIATDCLLLVTGPEAGEMVVVERTPTRAAVREARDGFIAVANDYLRIDADTGEVGSELMATSCGRFDRAVGRLGSSRPQSPEACLDVLRDPGIQMGITVQQMVLHARSGRTVVQRPV